MNILRRLINLSVLIGYNGYIPGFLYKKFYQAGLKNTCIPGLNCYSCPGAFFSCPVGQMQHFFGYVSYRFPLFIAGFIGIVGMASGRFSCGWLCPFGFIQEMIGKLSSKKYRLPRWIRSGKYAALIILVIIAPLLFLEPYFCMVCPAGTLEAGLPIMFGWDIAKPGLFFAFKVLILLTFLVGSVFFKRPFCGTACPLGAIYSLFNSVSFLQMKVARGCTECGECLKACPVDINIYKNEKSPECIRCFACEKVCPVNVISHEWEWENDRKMKVRSKFYAGL